MIVSDCFLNADVCVRDETTLSLDIKCLNEIKIDFIKIVFSSVIDSSQKKTNVHVFNLIFSTSSNIEMFHH